MAQGLFNLKQVNQAVQQGAWTTGIKTPSVDYLVVAGGGGCGVVGGGGGGGLLTGSIPVVSGSALTVTVGAGGGTGAAGSDSVFYRITSTGGGSIGQYSGFGGSGGGGAHSGELNGGQAVGGQGNRGGNNPSGTVNAGGGGGAGTVGIDSASTVGGDGGQGVALAISGTMTAYSGGGGGSGSGTQGLGGAGGGGTAVSNASGGGNSGTANTGGGAGGTYAVSGGTGGSGIVIVSYPDVYAAATSTTGSPTVSTSGSGSNLFVRGSGQFLSYANASSQFSFGTGAFTIECWVRLVSMPSSTGYPASYWLFGGGPVNANAGCDFYINNTQIGFNLADFGAPTTIGNHGMTTNTWYHVAVVRGGGSNQTVSIYVNGTRTSTAGSVTATADPALTGIAISAAEPSGATSGNLDGYISNYRIVKGTAVYDPTSASLTVPTAPLTAITNTQLLLNTVSGAFSADSSANGLSPNSSISVSPTWNALSPFTVTGYKNRVYKWTSSGSITF